MTGKIEEIVKLPSSDEVLWVEPVKNLNKKLITRLLDEASEMGLEGDDSEVEVTYHDFIDGAPVMNKKSTKTLGYLKDRYHWFHDVKYAYNSPVLQNI